MSKFIYFDNDKSPNTYCTGDETCNFTGKAPKYWSDNEDHNGSVCRDINRGEAKEFSVWKKVGVVKKVTKKGEVMPFRVGDLVKNKSGDTYRILCIDNPHPTHTMVATNIRTGSVHKCTSAGIFYMRSGSGFDLIPNIAPDSEEVEFVPCHD